jgi:hypothetical protein
VQVGIVGEVVARIGTYRGVRGEEKESDVGEADTEVVEGEGRSEVLRWAGFGGDIALAGVIEQSVVEEMVECNSVSTSVLGVVFSIVLQARQSVCGGGHRY